MTNHKCAQELRILFNTKNGLSIISFFITASQIQRTYTDENGMKTTEIFIDKIDTSNFLGVNIKELGSKKWIRIKQVFLLRIK